MSEGLADVIPRSSLAGLTGEGQMAGGVGRGGAGWFRDSIAKRHHFLSPSHSRGSWPAKHTFRMAPLSQSRSQPVLSR